MELRGTKIQVGGGQTAAWRKGLQAKVSPVTDQRKSSFSRDDGTTVPHVQPHASAVSRFKVERSVPAEGRAAHAARGQMHEHVGCNADVRPLFSSGPEVWFQ